MAVEKAEPGRIADGRKLEVEHLVETLRISPTQARALLERYGNDFERIRTEAEKLGR